MSCRFAGLTKPRLLRTHLRDCEGVCDGCEPCPERHCGICGREHVTVDGRGTDQTCASCIGEVRTNITGILTMSTRLLGEAIHRGVNSEAANLAGPVADPEAWSYRAASARQGRADHVSLTEDDDISSPLWVLGTWEMLVREHYEQPTDRLVSVTLAAEYLGGHLTRLAQDASFAFEELAREVRRCHGHLEDVLREGEREERGAPCPMCGGRYLVKDYGAEGEDVRWKCPRAGCNAWYTEHDYREKVEAIYVGVADRLTLTDLPHRVLGVPAGTIRRWASGPTPLLRSCGRTEDGRKLYLVAEVERLRDERMAG